MSVFDDLAPDDAIALCTRLANETGQPMMDIARLLLDYTEEEILNASVVAEACGVSIQDAL